MKGIRRQKRGERVVKYHRASGLRLPDLPENHPDFMAAWAAAEAGVTDPQVKAQKNVPAGSVTSVVNSFLASQDFRAASKSYQGIMRRHAEAIKDAYGTAAFKLIASRHIEADLEKLEPNPANQRLKAWRKLALFAIRKGYTENNAAERVKKRKVAVIGHRAWTADEVKKYRGRWPVGTVQRACFELLYWTGARTNDAVRLSPDMVGADGVLTFRQNKTGGEAHIPWTCDLPDYAEGWDRDALHAALACLSGGKTFLEAQGRVRSFKGLSNVISDGAKDAGLTGCTAHGLRKSRLTLIAQAGGSAHAIMAWGGHKTLHEAAEYTRAADMKRLVSGRERYGNDVSPQNNATIRA